MNLAKGRSEPARRRAGVATPRRLSSRRVRSGDSSRSRISIRTLDCVRAEGRFRRFQRIARFSFPFFRPGAAMATEAVGSFFQMNLYFFSGIFGDHLLSIETVSLPLRLRWVPRILSMFISFRTLNLSSGFRVAAAAELQQENQQNARVCVAFFLPLQCGDLLSWASIAMYEGCSDSVLFLSCHYRSAVRKE